MSLLNPEMIKADNVAIALSAALKDITPIRNQNGSVL